MATGLAGLGVGSSSSLCLRCRAATTGGAREAISLRPGSWQPRMRPGPADTLSVAQLPSHGAWRSTSRRASVRSSGSASPEGQGPTQEEEEAAAANEVRRLEQAMPERRAVDRSETLLENPYSPVDCTMSTPAVTTTPETLVGELLERFEHFTGLPVVDEGGRCVGIISSIDVFRHQRKASASITNALVRDIMTTPAVVIHEHAPIAYAAGLMLKHKVHRLPVVNHQDVVVGIVTRTDIYEPLIPQVNPLFHRLSGAD